MIVKRACISIFSKIGLVDRSKPCTQIYLQKFANCINLQLAIRISKKSRRSDIPRKEIISTDDRRTDAQTDVAYDNNR